MVPDALRLFAGCLLLLLGVALLGQAQGLVLLAACLVVGAALFGAVCTFFFGVCT
jgi:hypothetical protein